MNLIYIVTLEKNNLKLCYRSNQLSKNLLKQIILQFLLYEVINCHQPLYDEYSNDVHHEWDRWKKVQLFLSCICFRKISYADNGIIILAKVNVYQLSSLLIESLLEHQIVKFLEIGFNCNRERFLYYVESTIFLHII